MEFIIIIIIIIPLMVTTFYYWTLYTSDVKERPLLNSSFYAILNHLPDDGHQIAHNM
jgi:uncharacterized membrane protein